MKSEFVGGREAPWRRITRIVSRSKGRHYAAIAYVGSGANKMLPLRAGDVLVVDGSRASVKAGRTDPRELLKFQRRGVRIHSREGLHSKVVACQRVAIVGSANASSNSMRALDEAILITSQPAAVGRVREYVRSLLGNELGPAELRQLARIFVPPRGVLGPRKRLPTDRQRLLVVQLTEKGFVSEPGDEAAEKAGKLQALRRLSNRKTHEVQDYKLTGKGRDVGLGDQLLQVVETKRGALLVEPVGKVLWKQKVTHKGKRTRCFVYIEVPRGAARPLATLVKRIGRGAKKALMRHGVLRGQIKARVLAAMVE